MKRKPQTMPCCTEVEEGKKPVFLSLPCTTSHGNPWPQLYCRECIDELPDFLVDDCHEVFGDFPLREEATK